MAMVPLYLRGSKGVFWVVDATQEDAFENLSRLMDRFQEVLSSEEVVQILAVNKMDLIDGTLALDPIRQFCLDHKMDFYLTSAKTGQGITELFSGMAASLLQRFPFFEEFEHTEASERPSGYLHCC
jgi:50S ribosomal subunit-associated GTPase HflX